MLFSNKNTGRQEEIDIRPFKAGDEESFKNCISDFYGNGYPYKEYFDKAFLTEMRESGKLYILCAFARNGEIAGTVGARISDDFPGSAIMCLRVVKKQYRGLGIASMQRTMLLEYLQGRDDIRSIYVDALAHDKFSQQDLLQFGFVTCGIRLQLYRANIMIPGGGYDESERISQTIMCKTKGKQNAGEIFYPKEHEDIVTDCYRRLNVSYKLCSGKTAAGNTKIDSHFDDFHGSAELIIRNSGTDFEDKIKKYIVKAENEHIKSTICYLNISCDGAENAYYFLKEQGFVFCGIKPLNEDGEYMLMTRISDGKVKHHLINACDDAHKLLDYIEGEFTA